MLCDREYDSREHAHVLTVKDNFNKTADDLSILQYGREVENPDFTLCIPIYGRGRYLQDTLLNVKSLAQYGLVIQIIISDNKPCKESGNEVIRLLEEMNIDNVAYFNTNKELGQLNNFNRCALLCKTDYFGMVHDDDLLVHDYFGMVKSVLPFLRNKGNVGMVHMKCKQFNGIITEKMHTILSFRLGKIRKRLITHRGDSCTGTPTCGTVFNKELFIKYGGFNDDYPSSGDSFLGASMIEDGVIIYQFESTTGYYRIGNNTSINTKICQGFIIQDEAFRREWKSLGGFLRKNHMKFFSRYIYSRNIKRNVEKFAKYNPEITVESLDVEKRYKHYGKLSPTKFLFLLIYALLKLKEKIYSKRFKIKKEK